MQKLVKGSDPVFPSRLRVNIHESQVTPNCKTYIIYAKEAN